MEKWERKEKVSVYVKNGERREKGEKKERKREKKEGEVGVKRERHRGE